EARELDGPDRLRDREDLPAADPVDEEDARHRDRERPGARGEVRGESPLEVQAAEQLRDEREGEDRVRPVPDVGLGVDVLDEQRKPGATEALLVGLDVVGHDQATLPAAVALERAASLVQWTAAAFDSRATARTSAATSSP